jgi:hypothetical protein
MSDIIQMTLPYHPGQLIGSSDGKRIIEQDRAPLAFMEAQIDREMEELDKAERRLPRGRKTIQEKRDRWFLRMRLVQQFAAWTKENADRDPLSLTFGNFVRETGVLIAPTRH